MNDDKEIETTLSEDESLIDLEDMEDEELPPPEEENEAREINVGNIFAVILIGILILFLSSTWCCFSPQKQTSI